MDSVLGALKGKTMPPYKKNAHTHILPHPFFSIILGQSVEYYGNITPIEDALWDIDVRTWLAIP